MTKYSELREGWYWARPVGSHEAAPGKTVGEWCFVYVKGEAPFLDVWPAIVGAASTDWWLKDGERRIRSMDNDVKWEFGPRIELPQEVTA